MRLAINETQDGLGKAKAVVSAFPYIWSDQTVLDVGCRGQELRRALAGRCSRYIGVDLGAATVCADAQRLPFPQQSIDIAVALDVLEHTDDIHQSFAELCRVTDGHVVVALPNVYDLKIRVAVARGHELSKYGLPEEKPRDRHRWFFSFEHARIWTHSQAYKHGRNVVEERALLGPRRAATAGWAAERWPNLLAETYLALLAPRRDVPPRGEQVATS